MSRLAVVLLAGLVAACGIAPEPLHIGSDACAQCRMTVSEPQFASQVLSTRGRSFKFDSIECMISFLQGGQLAEADVHSSWVADFDEPEQWLPVQDALFVRSPDLRSPMGGGLSAHGSRAGAAALIAELGSGEIVAWDALRSSTVVHDHGAAAPAAADATAELRVGAGEAFETIAAALAAAPAGARIRVRAGVYAESPIHVSKAVELVGEGFPVLDGVDRHEIMVVTADDVTVRGFHFRGAGSSFVADNAALRFEGVRGCAAEGNRLEDNFFGIYVARSNGCTIHDNEISASGRREATSGNGVHLWNSDRVTVTGNRIRGHRDGIYLEYANHTDIRHNVSEGNLRYGLHFMFSHDSRYVRNTFRSNGAGAAVMYSRRVEMTGNRFADNWGAAAYGLLLKEISDSDIRDNDFVRNTTAVYSEGSTRIAVERNRFAGNGWAVRIMSNSRENRFAANDFIDNSFDVTTDSRRNANVFDGNYWSRYDGYDLTGDGVGDVPHRPVRLFSLIVQRNPATLVLLRGHFVELLDRAERVLPVLTPETLVDARPLMKEVRS